MGPVYFVFLKLENFVKLESREVGDFSRKSIKMQGFDKNSNDFGAYFVHLISILGHFGPFAVMEI